MLTTPVAILNKHGKILTDTVFTPIYKRIWSFYQIFFSIVYFPKKFIAFIANCNREMFFLSWLIIFERTLNWTNSNDKLNDSNMMKRVRDMTKIVRKTWIKKCLWRNKIKYRLSNRNDWKPISFFRHFFVCSNGVKIRLDSVHINIEFT